MRLRARSCGKRGPRNAAHLYRLSAAPGRPAAPARRPSVKRTYQPNVRPPEAQAWLSCAYVDPRRRDHQASPGEGPRAAVGVADASLVQRRQRLSRSRDFDVVYRQGRSTRRGTSCCTGSRVRMTCPRRGSGSPFLEPSGRLTRNAVKRKLRLRDELGDAVPAGRDYLLVARPGLAEAEQAQGHVWLLEQLRDALGKAGREAPPLPRYRTRVRVAVHTRSTHAGWHLQVSPELSQYAIDALRLHGLVKGSAYAAWRLLHCNPWSHGGVDYAADATFRRANEDRMIVGAFNPWCRSRTCSPTSSSGCMRAPASRGPGRSSPSP